ncbi:MAG: substrate-binding domain-containing protein [Micromonosporaceae bacterium]
MIVVRFDNIPEAAFLIPSLTTVHQDFDEPGQRGLQLLVEIIDNDHADSNGRNRVPARLITRRSSAKPSHGRSGTERHSASRGVS